MPQRSEVDPRGILGALPDAFILERIAPTVARVRVAGSHISDLLGMEARGMPASCLIMPASRDAFGRIIEDIVNHPASAQLALAGNAGLGWPRLKGQMLLLPLRSDTGEVNRMLGCLATQGKPGKGPRRFEVKGSALRRVRSAVAEPARALPVPPAVRETVGDAPLFSRPNTRQVRTSPIGSPSARLQDTSAPHLKLVVNEPA